MSKSDGGVNYAKLCSIGRRHHERWKRRVESRKPQLTCQECGGSGGEVQQILECGSGPWEECGWCEGTGLMDNWARAEWLGWRKELKQTATATDGGQLPS